MRRFLLPLAIFIVLVGFLAVGLRLNPREVPSPLIGKPVPSFRLPQLQAPDQSISPEDLRGKVWLLNVWASWCHKVHLVDLSSELLKLAQQEIAQNEVTHNVLGISKMDARDLSNLESNSFDATLVMGPLYHLLQPKDRSQCLKEAHRITKPGGIVFSAVINLVCPFIATMHEAPEALAHELSEDTDELHRILSTGQYENFEENPNEFTDAYFSNIYEVPKIYSQLRVEAVETFAFEGLAAYMYDKAGVIRKNDKAWARFLDVIFENSTRPELLGTSEHVVFVGRKVE